MTAMNTTAASVPRSWRAFQAQWARGYGESGSGVADMQTEAIVDWSSIYLCAGAIRGSINGVYMSYYPSLGCISVRPPNVSCTFSASSLVLDHGTLSEQSINGNKATSNINIQCNNAATYKANISNTDVDLGGGVRSTVAFDGYANNANVSVANSKVLTLSSTLRTSGSVTPGEHTGNTVILFSIQ
ncbi:MrpH family fimbial adhesin [Providencia sp. Me31A]|uniref:MrpH family fimbial adhesin n=1 Tax=Providencia sp. Me31A TaxID=3392637 RepID=UPI003D2D4865